MTDKIELVEYQDKFAPGIKDMWDNSIKNWNGESHLTTVERIIDQENNSSHLHLTLAKLKDYIAGYCKLSLDHNDSNALYIDLLNVRDDFQGKKIGKQLVLDALVKTINLGWERLHLNTWPGNVKAVPLYKKCGFFWEDRDDTTHLINLMPIVLKCELFKDFFKNVEWYKDSKRKIEIEPDSKLENEFNIWKYSWEKNNQKLDVEFTRRGRGIRKVETNDFIIEAIIKNPELVCGQSYKIKYKIVNKSGKKLDVKLNGLDDRNIKFDFNKSINVTETSTIEADFSLEELLTEQPEWETHPSVITNLEVNGKNITFKTGIVPKAPLSVNLVCEDINDVALNRGNCCKYYLNIQNNNKEVTKYSFTIPGTENLTFSQEDFYVTLKPNEKRSIALETNVSSSTFYVENIKVVAYFNKDIQYEFNVEISQLFSLGYGSYSGECKKSIKAGIGNYYLSLNKSNNKISFNSLFKSATLDILPVMLGYPFSGEFETKQFRSFSVEKGEGLVLLKIYYDSDTYNSVSVIRYLKLYVNGILERWFKVISDTDRYNQDFYINDKIKNGEVPARFCYANSLVSLEQDNSYNLEYWDSNLFTENWIYSNVEDSNIGLTWSEKNKLQIDKGEISLITHLGKLNKGSQVDSGLITITFNTFDKWSQFRDFSNKKRCKNQLTKSNVNCVINNGNPFVQSNKFLEVKSLNSAELSGSIEYSIDGESNKFDLGDRTQEELSLLQNKRINTVKIEYNDGLSSVTDHQTIFIKGSKLVTLCENDIFTVDNGVISFKASLSFGPAIYSLKYEDNEWLDSNYPEVTSKSWWNPWCGGLFSFPDGFSLKSLLEEKTTMEFVERKDNKGNIWAGIKINIDIIKDSNNSGFSYSQYFLTQPETPVLMYFNEYKKSGEFSKVSFISNNFFSGNKNIEDLSFNYLNKKGHKTRLKGGSDGFLGETEGHLILSNKNTNESLINLCGYKGSMGHYLNKDISLIWLANSASAINGKTGKTHPNFIVFSEDEIVEGSLNNLHYLTD